MAVRGVFFQIPQDSDCFLSKILEEIQIERYFWKVTNDEVYLCDSLNNSLLFSQDKMNGQNLQELIRKPSYWIIFVNLQAYLTQEDVIELKTYADFQRSQCQLALLISDSIYVDIYVKEKKILDQLIKNARKYGFKKIRLITKENDCRTALNEL